MARDKQTEPEDLDCIAVCIMKGTDRFGGYVTHKLRLTQADLDRLTVSRSEPEIVGVVAGMVERDIFRWVDR